MKEVQAKQVRGCLRAEISQLAAYPAVNHSAGILLDNMENPHSLIDEHLLIRAFRQAKSLNRYPDPQQTELRQRVAEYFQVLPEQLLFGNGSDELISLLTLAVGNAHSAVLSVTPGFAVYSLMAIAASREFISVPLKADFELDTETILAKINTHKPCLVFLALSQ